jgi:CDP-alcohol phosphatidyltransferase-like enzyme
MKVTIKEIREQAAIRDKTLELSFLEKTFRKISIYLAKPVLRFPISANMVTFVSVLAGIIAAGFFTVMNPISLIIGTLFIFFGEFLDTLDGLIARCKKQVTKLQSTYLGSLFHEVSTAFIYAGLGVGMFRFTGNPIFMYLGFSATASQLLTVYLLQLREKVIYKFSEAVKDKDIHHDPSRIGIKTKEQNFLLKIFTVPMIKIREITVVFVILFAFGYNFFPLYLYFYGIFLTLRVILFFAHGYMSLKKMEK